MKLFIRFSICTILSACLTNFGCGSALPPPTPAKAAVNVPDANEEPSEENHDDESGFLSDFYPYFDDVRNGEAAAFLAEDKLEDALAGFDDIILTSSDIQLTPRARFLAGYIAERIGDDARAVKELTYAANELPLTADLA